MSTIRTEQGSALILVLTLLAVASIFCVSFSNSIVNMQKNIAYSNHKYAREFEISQIMTLIKVQNGLTESSQLTQNSILASCLFGTPTATCAENCCPHNSAQGFYFIDPSDNTIDINSKNRLVGPPESPAWYNANSSLCQNSNKDDCSYGLSATFEAACPGAQPTCHHAEHLLITLHLLSNQNAKGNSQNIKARDIPIIYFNNINYPPVVMPVSDLTLSLAAGTEKTVDITGSSGHPSETQNFIFTKCFSTDTGIVQITSPPDTPFSSGMATIKLKPMAAGTAQVTLQINDGGLENNTSKDYTFNVTVTP
ncbi:hypothetical protein [Bdellovibrio svalbardensis]|uniref:Type 4 fimbrial biogenesis protein PilX N-terminal domain-containing protein n=1 Tax=Bdellovibrio svalbardensis TaxID=2972972 RepID=A0ABT6DNA0_9BACT|nr:hypothetical protein [Bdellovibrio svalbardensis]MDG0817414.1 hypothetical protein [Bdellovibrio svalbardensis]